MKPTVLVTLLALAAPAAAQPAPATDDKVAVTVGGYVQPAATYRQDDDTVVPDEDGFRVRRARLVAAASRAIERTTFTAFVEAELTPDFQLLDAYVTAAADFKDLIRSTLTLDAGQVKAPISRQELLSDSALAFPDKAELASLAPGRQIGVRLAIETAISTLISTKLSAGMFNGEGRNLLSNVDEKYLFAGRLEVTAGARRKLAESDFDGGAYVTAALSVGRNDRVLGGGDEEVTLVGFDVAGAWNGVSGAFEYLQAQHDFDNVMQTPYRANGFATHLAYLLPFELAARGRLEVAARIEEIDRNDEVAITAPGEAEQSLRYYTGAVSYYQRGHSLKAQLSYSHIDEVEDRTQAGSVATYKNDTVLFQITYRME